MLLRNQSERHILKLALIQESRTVRRTVTNDDCGHDVPSAYLLLEVESAGKRCTLSLLETGAGKQAADLAERSCAQCVKDFRMYTHTYENSTKARHVVEVADVAKLPWF